VVAVGLLAALEAVRIGTAVHDLADGSRALADAATALGNSPEAWSEARIGAAARLRDEAARTLQPARAQLNGDPLLRLLVSAPLVGDQVRAIQHLADGATSGAAAFADIMRVARSYEAARHDPGPAGPRLLRLIGASRQPLADAAGRLRGPTASLRQDMGRPLVPPLRSRVSEALRRLEPVTVEAGVASAAGDLLPAALGANGQRRYLLLFADPAELRPAGGWVGAIGSVTFDKATPGNLEVRSQDVLNSRYRERFPVPSPLDRYMTFYGGALEIGDAGWDPDFPSSARLTERMYLSATGQNVDGTVLIDPYAISAILAVTGPLDVPGYGSFDSSNAFARILRIVDVDTGPGSGKQALAAIAQAIVQRVLDQPVTGWPRLLAALRDAGQNRHLLMYLHDSQLADAAARGRLDGALLNPTADSVMVSDANVGATKGDYYMRKSATIQVEVPSSGISRHEIQLHYSLPSPADAADRALNPGAGVYRDYVRVYLPENATVGRVSYLVDGQPGPGGLQSLGLDHGHRVVAVFFTLDRGHEGEVRIDYEVGLGPGSPYQLFVQKQAGLPSRPTTVAVSYPGGIARWRDDLAADRGFEVRW
jgi:hypothetical protein